jgi:hypothetical protein
MGQGEGGRSRTKRRPLREFRTARRMTARMPPWPTVEPTMGMKIARWRTSSVVYSLIKSMRVGRPEGTVQLRSLSSGERLMSSEFSFTVVGGGILLSSASVEKVNCRPGITGAYLMTKLGMPWYSFALKHQRNKERSLLYMLWSAQARALFFFLRRASSCLS